MIDKDHIRSLFPQLKDMVYGKPLVYLDNAATTLRPQSVVNKWDDMSEHMSSNLHRAVHCIAGEATAEFEAARKAVAAFIGADSPDEVVFTSGATHSLNLLAFTLGESVLKEGDEILVCESEHHSNLVPWQMLAERKSLKIKVLPIEDNGEIALKQLPSLLTSKTRVCCVAQASNVLGIVNPISEIADQCHKNGTLLVVDGAQGVVHCITEVKALGADFYAFSGHKIYAAPGTGVLWGKKALLEALPPYMGGGEMISSVSWEKTTFAAVPARFEAGTQNMAGVPTFVPALAFAKDTEVNPEIVAFMLKELSEIEGLRLFGIPRNTARKLPIFSFAIEGAHHEDLALILDKMGIAVRSGQMCAEPLMARLGVSGVLRASFAPYNTMQEAQYFTESLRKAVTMLK